MTNGYCDKPLIKTHLLTNFNTETKFISLKSLDNVTSGYCATFAVLHPTVSQYLRSNNVQNIAFSITENNKFCFPHPQDVNTDKDVTFGNSCMNSPTKNGLDKGKSKFLSSLHCIWFERDRQELVYNLISNLPHACTHKTNNSFLILSPKIFANSPLSFTKIYSSKLDSYL